MFVCSAVVNYYPKTPNNANNNQYSFLTFEGVLRVLFVSKNHQIYQVGYRDVVHCPYGNRRTNKIISLKSERCSIRVHNNFSVSAIYLPFIYLIHLSDVKTQRCQMCSLSLAQTAWLFSNSVRPTMFKHDKTGTGKCSNPSRTIF